MYTLHDFLDYLDTEITILLIKKEKIMTPEI